ICRENPPDLLIMDEIIGACATGLISEDKLIHFLTSKPIQTEVVLTGRDPSQQLIDLADYVSEVKKIKHPFDKGIEARIGIEE
ncbi:MAG: cob(I)yrinic acid a,c-diamide adenosyltransferase, partial [Megasphaera micronuciformis]|nr:cob(I)yrinic acid a,c-diamide adenosyltransferase [Megasphaera micronuciformis]